MSRKKQHPEGEDECPDPTPKKQQPSNDRPVETPATASLNTPSADEVSQHPTVPNIGRSASGELVSKAIIQPTGHVLAPGGIRDPAANMEPYNANKTPERQPLRNPWENFYDLYQCYDKDPEGSPTYDSAGFQLDYDKVCAWMKPQAYNKRKMVSGMERALAKGESEMEQMFRLFFTEKWDDPRNISSTVKDYVQDQVSKDLGIPWHLIGPDQVQLWRESGFQPVKFEEWWSEPNEVEKGRMSKMMGGASLRKDVWPAGTEPKNKGAKAKPKKETQSKRPVYCNGTRYN